MTPDGRLVAESGRGAWLGNRGCIHRGFVCDRKPPTDRWIVCLLEFKGRRRQVMSPGKYTEIFFLDEATAFAAGHRPCFECRRPAAAAFASLAGVRRMAELDALLARERSSARRWSSPSVEPPGTFFLNGSACLLWWQGMLWPWSMDGYGEPTTDTGREMTVLTPATTLRVLAAGYPVQVSAPLSF